ncbi:hypothetical protein E0Z10_g8161 [Xylaria hypoxylon]|uniref:Uncharacterized protein n=1 Tax=Xylaria hypoxylon TaxID=37992 RepID=A0A4Z0YQ37_9PEZI|nr:hypothetical protein E0Z10_g8161 [Xylaria hypoxylon]
MARVRAITPRNRATVPRQRATMLHNRAARAAQVAQVAQVDHTQSPTLAGAVGHALTNGMFQCTRMDRHGKPTNTECGNTMKNEKHHIRSHLNKLHNPDSKYAKSQASFAKANELPQLRCDRPRLDGKGWCTRARSGQHSLVEHAHRDHEFRGKSDSLFTPWKDLSDKQRAYYLERIDLKKRYEQNGSVYNPEDETLRKRFEKEKFPDA